MIVCPRVQTSFQRSFLAPQMAQVPYQRRGDRRMYRSIRICAGACFAGE
jgi:hypothetical protein